VNAGAAIEQTLGVLGPVMDIVEGRVGDDAPPDWCERRGWSGFLLALDDGALARCETAGLAASAASLAAPRELAALAAAVARLTALPELGPAPASTLTGVPARKRRQVAALAAALDPMTRVAGRVVDVGAGRGPFARAVAPVAGDVLGLERDPARVAVAEARGGGARYAVFDAHEHEIALRPSDLVVGLHACGDLGDWVVRAAGPAGCDVALVSCCLQKIRAEVRQPLSRAAAGFRVPRAALGLSNLVPSEHGVEVSLATTMEARVARLGLRLLLRARGLDVAHGEEMRGINRRQARRGLGELAARALALRALAPATDEELRGCSEEARHRHARMRRLTLPRSMLGRLVELAVVLDRAAALEERGLHVACAALAGFDVTPRNLVLFASASEARLPAVL
jgi:SAM-dependent methyltransferase